MYISSEGDEVSTLTVRHIDGSQSKLSLNVVDYFGGYRFSVLLCSDDGLVVFDGSIIKCSKDGELIWIIEPETTQFFAACLDPNDLLYCATSDQVKVYLPSGAFSHVLVSDLKEVPSAIAIDGDNNVHVGFYSSILQVFNTEGKLIRQYGHDGLHEVDLITISRGNPQLVVVAEILLSHQLFVFNSTGSFLYSVTNGFSVHDVKFGPDNSLWIASACDEPLREFIVRVPMLFHQLPPPLSYLCELSILPHLNELPVSLLPPRLAGLFEKWTDLVTVQVKFRSFTDHPSESKLISETIELKVEPNAPVEMVKWLVEKKMNLKPSAITIRRMHGGDEDVDFVVNELQH